MHFYSSFWKTNFVVEIFFSELGKQAIKYVWKNFKQKLNMMVYKISKITRYYCWPSSIFILHNNKAKKSKKSPVFFFCFRTFLLHLLSQVTRKLFFVVHFNVFIFEVRKTSLVLSFSAHTGNFITLLVYGRTAIAKYLFTNVY